MAVMEELTEGLVNVLWAPSLTGQIHANLPEKDSQMFPDKQKSDLQH